MSEEKKLAVLIDSDNVSAKYAQFVMNEVQKYGVPTYKRVYGDWEKGGTRCPVWSFPKASTRRRWRRSSGLPRDR